MYGKDRIMKLDEVMERTRLSKSMIRLKMLEGTFPKSVKTGKRLVGWRETDIDNWIAELK